MEEFQEVTLESERLILKRARYGLHYNEINKVVCSPRNLPRHSAIAEGFAEANSVSIVITSA